MLRCEVDACFAPEADAHAEPTLEGSKSTTADDLADVFSALAVSGASHTPGTTADVPLGGINVIKGGSEVAQSSLIKIKSRSEYNVKNIDWAAVYIQLFLGQTPNLFTGVHKRGLFYEVQRSTFDSPELKAALLTRRNYNWSQWIERRMAQPGAVMVAVGAGHLAGEESVQRYLQSRGYNVKRLQ